jgi:hypothetical protein
MHDAIEFHVEGLRLAGEQVPEPHANGFGNRPFKAQLPANCWRVQGGGHNVPECLKTVCWLPPKPPSRREFRRLNDE